MTAEVASRLASELVTLHAKVLQFPYFRPPSESTKELAPRLNELVELTTSASSQPQQSSVQRNSRAVSLPPNPELIHSRPASEQVDGEGTRDKGPEKMKIDSIVQRPEPTPERRLAGDGIPQFQPYWYTQNPGFSSKL